MGPYGPYSPARVHSSGAFLLPASMRSARTSSPPLPRSPSMVSRWLVVWVWRGPSLQHTTHNTPRGRVCTRGHAHARRCALGGAPQAAGTRIVRVARGAFPLRVHWSARSSSHFSPFCTSVYSTKNFSHTPQLCLRFVGEQHLVCFGKAPHLKFPQ